MISLREVTIRCYEAFLQVLKKMPLTHRYWFWFAGTWKEKEEEIASEEGIQIDGEIAAAILKELIIKLDNMKAMSDKEFDNASCDKIFCMLFHNPDYPVIVADGTGKKLIFLTENSKEGIETDIYISKNIYPLVLSRDVIYGNIKRERRYTSEDKNEIEIVFEEVI